MPSGDETIEILPAGERDRNGDPVGAPPAAVPVVGCKVWPRSSHEEGRGWVTLDGWSVWIPAGQPLPTAKDQVRARGEVWAVDSRPADYGDKGAIVALGKAS